MPELCSRAGSTASAEPAAAATAPLTASPENTALRSSGLHEAATRGWTAGKNGPQAAADAAPPPRPKVLRMLTTARATKLWLTA
jgi:hypothetical protein